MRGRAAIFDLKKSALRVRMLVVEEEGKCCSVAGAAAQHSSLHLEGLSTPQPSREGPGTWDGPGALLHPALVMTFCLLDPSSIKVPIEVDQVNEQHNTRSGRGPTRTGVPVVVFVVTRSCRHRHRHDVALSHWLKVPSRQSIGRPPLEAKLPPPRSQMHPRCPIAASLMQVSICHGHCRALRL